MISRRFLSRLFSGALPSHRETAYNNANTPFDFTDENYKEIERVLKKYPPQYKRSAIINLLYIAQKQCDNWVPLAAMNKIAKILELSEMDVYEVATFYTMFNREPVGKYHIQLCGTTPCMVFGAQEIKKVIEQECGILEGQTSKDGLFTLSEVECLGACVNAPMLQVNGEQIYEDLTPESMRQLIQAWRKQETPQEGPQVGRNLSEGVQGRTTLKTMPETPKFRDFVKLKQEVEEKKKAEEEEKKKAEQSKA